MKMTGACIRTTAAIIGAGRPLYRHGIDTIIFKAQEPAMIGRRGFVRAKLSFRPAPPVGYAD
jgi:hypothetical protein